MRILFVAGMACAACVLVQCTPRLFNVSSDGKKPNVSSPEKPNGDNQTPKNQDNGTTTGGATTGGTIPAVQVNPKASNAFNIWRDGQGSEILDYPQGYGLADGTTPDGVFYVERAAYWKDGKFIGVPTEGAKVVNDVLEYPAKNGKQLKLKFTKISEKEMTHLESVTYCKNQGLRLPTVREIFDFCAAGVTEPNYGPNYQGRKYPSTARCGETFLWSASVDSNDRLDAWQFNGDDGDVNYYARHTLLPACGVWVASERE